MFYPCAGLHPGFQAGNAGYLFGDGKYKTLVQFITALNNSSGVHSELVIPAIIAGVGR